ncbi:MAG: ABC transporter permease subunit, partial [Vicinamibacterales bacterium]
MTDRALSFWGASRRVFDLSLGEMLWSRRTIFMALVVGGPVILAIIVRLLEAFGMPALRVNGQRVGGIGVFGVMIWMLFLRFVIPVLGVFYGTALMADEIEDKTITYLFTRPIPRGAVLVGKYLAYLACTSLVVLPSVMVVYFLLVRFSEIPSTFGQLLTDLGLLALGLAVYGAVFALVGAFFKRPLVIGL